MSEDEVRVGPDYDPETDTAYDREGNPITSDYIDRVADEAEAGYDLSQARRIGRPPLAEGDVHSPRVSFRVPTDLRDAAEAKAAREGKSLSALAREALEQYVRAS